MSNPEALEKPGLLQGHGVARVDDDLARCG
jgi:hypothetical protein